MYEPLVSIVIPVYNGSNYLKEAIDSAIAQSYKSVEVIVVNDGSNDDGRTRDAALVYGDGIRYFEKSNGGVASALNFGIKEMRGEYFSWLSHDDVYYPGKIEKQIEFLNSLAFPPKAIVFSDANIIDDVGETVGSIIAPEIRPEKLVYSLLKQRYIGGCTLLIPKNAFMQLGLFDESLKTVQDYDLWFRMIKNGYLFTYCKEILVKTRVHEAQDSNNKRDLHRKEKDNLFAWVVNEFSDEMLWGRTALSLFYYLKLSVVFKKQKLPKSFHACMKKIVKKDRYITRAAR